MSEVDSEGQFEEYARDALDSLPSDLRAQMSNVEIVVDHEPPPGERLLGLYQGVPLTSRGTSYGIGMTMPDQITIYRQTISHYSHSEEELVDRVRTTVIHEVAHHFGISDERLDELGWA